MFASRRPPLLSVLGLLLALAPLAQAADAAAPTPPPFATAEQFEYKLPADYPLHWWVPQDRECSFLVQEPQDKLAPDAPIFIYMHRAGGHQEEGMGLAAGPTDPERTCWDCLRGMLSERGWIYVCPEFHEFDHLLQDLQQRYGKRPVYVAGSALGGRALLEDIKAHAGQSGRYAGVALLSPAVDLRFYPDDGGLGDITRADFPMPVYLLAGTADGPVASATARLYGVLSNEGTPAKFVLLGDQEQGGTLAGSDWQDILDFLTSAKPGEGDCEVRSAQRRIVFEPAGRRTAPPGTPFPVAPEPRLVTCAPRFSYWAVEPLFGERLRPDSSVVIFIDGDEPNRLRGLGCYGGGYGLDVRDRAATAAWQQLAVTLSNRGWLYVLPRRHWLDGLDQQLTARYGRRPTYLIGVAEGGRAALEEALAQPGRYSGLMLMQPDLDAAAIEAATHAAQLPPVYITARASATDPVTRQCRKLAAALKSAGKPVKLVELTRPPEGRPVEGTDWADAVKFLTAPR